MCSMALVPVAAEDAVERETYERLKSDPAVTVADLQEAIEIYFELQETRNMAEVLDEIDGHKVNWKTAPQATTHTPTTPFSFRSCL